MPRDSVVPSAARDLLSRVTGPVYRDRVPCSSEPVTSESRLRAALGTTGPDAGQPHHLPDRLTPPVSTSPDAPPPAPPDPAAEDFYARLGVARDAAPDAVRAAYRDAVRRHPPERDAEAFKRVREAFETLDDADARARYDLLRDEDSPAALFARAERAMAARDYADAAHLFKRLLLDDPGAGRARNLLGLCFLYQGDPASAAAQYDRLLAGPEAQTVWFLNAGHAYREAKRPGDARRALALAGARPDADQADVAIALADVAIDAGDYQAAHEAVRDGLRKHPPGTPGAVQLLLRRVDVTLHAREEAQYRATLSEAERAAAEIGWQKQGAYRLGVVAWKLIDAGAFSLAFPAAEAARRLQPDDLDYDALPVVAGALGVHDLARARQTVRTHVAFEQGKWLAPLGPRVLAYCDEHAAYDGMKPLKAPPSLTLVNGVGTRLLGKHDPDARTGTYVSTLYFLALFVPLFPIRRYRVRDAEKRGWHFLGVLPLAPRQRLHRNVAFGLAAVLALWIVITAVADARARGRAASGAGDVVAAATTPRVPRAPVIPVAPPDTPARRDSRGPLSDSAASAAATDSELAAADASPPARDDFEARRRVLDLRYFQLKRLQAANDAERRDIARERGVLRARGGEVAFDASRLNAREATLHAHVTDWQARTTRFKADSAAFNADVDRSNAPH